MRRRLPCALLLLVFLSTPAYPDVLEIPAAFPTIASAVLAASSGDTLLLAPGFYQESIQITSTALTIGSHYLLDGSDEWIEATHWVSGHDTSSAIAASGIFQGSLTLAGLWFTPSVPFRGGVITMMDSRHLLIENCRFVANYQDTVRYVNWGGAVDANRVDSLTIMDSFFQGCRAFRGGAVAADSCDAVLLVGNRFTGNVGLNVAGAFAGEFSSGEILNNEFIENQCLGVAGGSTYLSGWRVNGVTNRWSVRGNDFIGNKAKIGGAIHIFEYPHIRIEDNRFIRNEAIWFSFPMGGAISIQRDSEHYVIAGNLFYRNHSIKQGGALNLLSQGSVHHNQFVENEGGTSSAIATQYDFHDNMEIVAEVHDNLFIRNRPTIPDFYLGTIAATSRSGIRAWNNDFYDNQLYAVGTVPPRPGDLEIDGNYWGDPSGPYQEVLNSEGLGDTLHPFLHLTVELNTFSAVPLSPWQPPGPFQLLEPAPGEPIDFEEEVQFVWQRAADPNEGDQVFYVLEFSDSVGFIEVRESYYASMDTSYIVHSPILQGVSWWRVLAADTLGLNRISDPREIGSLYRLEDLQATIPENWELYPPYPNPFNSLLTVKVDVPDSGYLRIAVIDLLGREVGLLHSAITDPGHHTFSWDPSGLASGVYMIRGESENWHVIRKAVLLK